jgi:hypothetical protein
VQSAAKIIMFNFTVKYFGFLKHIPFLPLLFDFFLKIETLIKNKQVLFFMDEIEEEVLSWQKTKSGFHKYGGIQFDTGKKEIGHIHSNGLLDILFSKEIKERLIAENKVIEHHIFKNSGWISFFIRTKQDKNAALELLKYSYELKFNPEPQRKKLYHGVEFS